MQITMGLPEPQEFSSLPRLRLVQSGIQQANVNHGDIKVRLPITPSILYKLKEFWTPQQTNRGVVMIWAAAVMCFFGFFRAGEITVPTVASFDGSKHLTWRDVAIDSVECPQTIKVHLKKSKTDQLGKGVDVYIGRTGDPLCPVVAVRHYVSMRGSDVWLVAKYV